MNTVRIGIVLLGAVALLWAGATGDYLGSMAQKERDNCIIQLEWSDRPTLEMIQASNLWNTGAYNDAIDLINEIESKLGDMQVAINYRKPIVTKQTRWATDVKVNGNSWNYRKLELILAQSGRIFTIAQGDSSSNYWWFVFMSTDGGFNWTQTAAWNGASYPIPGLDAAEWVSHVYVGYVSQSAPTSGRIRRVSETTGQMDNGFGYVDVFTTSNNIEEINIEPNRANWNELYYAAIDAAGTLHYFWTTDPATWTGIATNINSADRSLDMDYGYVAGGGHYLWLSYISDADSLCALARVAGSWSNHRNIAVCHTSSFFGTAIAHHGDTVMIWHESTSYYPYYQVTYNDGANWSTGTPYADSGGAFDITGRGNDGWHVCFASYSMSAPEQVYYVRRTYANTPWSTEIVIGEHDEYINYPMSIDYLGSPDAYGIVYIDDAYDIYFDRSDWEPGTAETPSETKPSNLVTLAPNPCRGQATLSYTVQNAGKVRISMYDAAGRLVENLVNKELSAGNYMYDINIKNLSAGVYFIRVDTDYGSSCTKMTIIR